MHGMALWYLVPEADDLRFSAGLLQANKLLH